MLHLNKANNARKIVGIVIFSLFSIPVFSQSENKTLVLYYSLINNQKIAERDADSSCSRVIIDDDLFGHTQLVAQIIKQNTNADIGFIVNSTSYSADYKETLAQAQNEKQQAILPTVYTTINADDYDTIFIGFPVWWYTMPMGLISFLQNSHLEGKNIYLFCTSRSTTPSTVPGEIQKILPECTVEPQLLIIKIDELSETEKLVEKWLKKSKNKLFL